jgi:hypothetical protein
MKTLDANVFSVDLPDEWLSKSTLAVSFDAPGPFRPNLVVSAEAVADKVSAEAYCRQQLDLLRGRCMSFEVIREPVAFTLGGRPAARVEHAWTPEQGYRLRQRQCFVRAPGRIYTLTITQLANRFEQDQAAFEAILNSFRLKGT